VSIKNLLFASSGSAPSSTLDQVDIFGDGSGVALYRFDGNTNDESGNYHGTRTNVTYGGGQFGRCAIVSNGKIDLGAGSKVLMPSTTGYSISTWIYNSGTASRRVIASRMDSSVGTGQSDYFMYESDNTLIFGKTFGSVDGNMEYLTYSPSFSVGWHPVVLSFDRVANIVDMYCDGILVATKNNWNSGSYDNNLNTLIGAFHNSNYNAYQDQTRFLNRPVTAAEVARLANELAPASIIYNIDPLEDGSLKAMYPFNDTNNDLKGVYNNLFTGATTYVNGKFGKAALVAGVASGSAAIPFPASTGECAISYFTNNQGARDRAFGFSQDGSHYLGVYSGGASFFVGSTTPVSLGYTIDNTATIKHFVWSFKGGKCKFYENGVLKATLTMAAGFTTLNSFTDGGGTATMLGEQVQIFNKYLTPMEVAALSSGVTPLEDPMCSQVDPFKDGSGKVLIRFEGNLLDESGNHDGVGTVLAYASSALGGRCGVFNGSSTYATLPNSFNSLNDYSIGIWVKSSSASRQFIFSKDNLAPKLALELNRDATNKVSVWFSNGSSTVFLHSTTSITDGERHLIGISKTSAEAKLNIDGIEIATVVPLAISEALQIILGKYDTGNFYFNGNQKQFRVFNRALSTSEWQTLHAKGA